MTLPLYAHGAFGYATGMALATAIGVGFGFVLERAGFGRATVLASQFYGRDNRVLKVMFSAIVTTVVGLGLLGGAGAVDLAALTVPETFYAPHLVGGLFLGAGFVVSGYCPGTALVSMGSGNVDAVWALGGIMLGAVGFGAAWPLLEGLYGAGAAGVVTFPSLLGVPFAVVAVGVVAMAVGAFLFAEWGEGALARKDGVPRPSASESPAVRNRIFAGFAAFAGLGLLTLALPAGDDGETSATADSRGPTSMSADELAVALIDRPFDLWLVDLRPAADCARQRLPGALCLSADDPDAAFLATLPPTRRLLLYDRGDVAEIPSSARSFGGRTSTLAGGMQAFEALVASVPRAPESTTVAELDAHALSSALQAHYSGSQAPPPPPPTPKAVTRKVKKGGGC